MTQSYARRRTVEQGRGTSFMQWYFDDHVSEDVMTKPKTMCAIKPVYLKDEEAESQGDSQEHVEIMREVGH